MKTQLFMRIFIISATAILIITGVAKLIFAFKGTQFTAIQDPILGIPFKHLFIGIGIVEVFVACVCLMAKTQQLQLSLIGWLSLSFLIYRIGLWAVGWQRPCGCMGNLGDLIQISPQTTDTITKSILVYLLVGTGTGILSLWNAGRKTNRLNILS